MHCSYSIYFPSIWNHKYQSAAVTASDSLKSFAQYLGLWVQGFAQGFTHIHWIYEVRHWYWEFNSAQISQLKCGHRLWLTNLNYLTAVRISWQTWGFHFTITLDRKHRYWAGTPEVQCSGIAFKVSLSKPCATRCPNFYNELRLCECSGHQKVVHYDYKVMGGMVSNNTQAGCGF